ncbi:MAG: hemerythrin-like metal-binding protein [Alphaproteobacteria bacterium]|nr:hemerythrin-like metal-binding protein [Alphaproteobacteria bacterium]
MALIEWHAEFETGIAGVDHEHRALIDLLNAMPAAAGPDPDRDAITRLLGEIHASIGAHFALEEAVMRERAYAEFADHKADHERLLDELRDIMEVHEAGLVPDYAALLGVELTRWFGEHFRTKDAAFHRARVARDGA